MSEQILYKYKKINKFTYDLLLNNEFYYSFPHEMNDPFDCYVYSEYRGNKDDYIKFLKRTSVSTEMKNNAYNFLDSCNFNSEEIYKKINLPVKDNTSDDVLVNCFSSIPDSIIMWSHYSDFHKGICLGFKAIKENNKFAFEVEEIVSNLGPESNKLAAVFEVKYSKVLPKPFNGLKDGMESLFEFIITKYFDWSYENEYRSIIWEKDLRKKKLKFKKTILKEVIFGMRTPEEEIKKITDLVNEIYVKQGFDVKLKNAQQAQKEYKINMID